MNDDRIGIDSIGFYAPVERLSLEELAYARGINPSKFLKGLYLREMAVPIRNEDATSMALNASLNAIYRGDIDIKSIDAVIVGTESAPDASKPIASTIAGLLGIENCLAYDVKHACAGQTYALFAAKGHIRDGIASKALVVGTDISRYQIGSSGEPTQGAGACAMIISKNPRIALINCNIGKISGNVNDFFRPPEQEHAEVFGKFSEEAYLEFQQQAFDDWKKNSDNSLPDYSIFHGPYAKLPIKIFKQIQSKGGLEGIVKEQIDISIEVPKAFGNMYSASVWAQVEHLMEEISENCSEKKLIYFGSYGSGATAISGTLTMLPTANDVLSKKPRVKDFMQDKVMITVPEYESSRQNGFIEEFNSGIIIPQGEEGIKMNFCKECAGVLSYNTSMKKCPRGHGGIVQRFFPKTAVLKSNSLKQINPLQGFVENENLVPLFGNPEEGQKLQLQFMLLREDKEDKLKHWGPVYVPSNF